MPDLTFHINDATVSPRSTTPELLFRLEVTNTPPEERIHTVILRADIQIEAARRKYNGREKEKLVDLFGEPERWGQTLRNTVWTQAHTTIPAFRGHTAVDLPAPCTLDLAAAATKYFYALEEGEVPLLFLFSGTVFYAGQGLPLQVHHIARSKECTYRMPVARWKEMIDRHYGNTAWLTLQRDLFNRLYVYKRRHGLATMDEAVEQLLAHAEKRPHPSHQSQAGEVTS